MKTMQEFDADCAQIAAEIDIGKEAIDEVRRLKAINVELLAALTRLRKAAAPIWHGTTAVTELDLACDEASTVIVALEAEAVQEPVAHVLIPTQGTWTFSWNEKNPLPVGDHDLYATPQQTAIAEENRCVRELRDYAAKNPGAYIFPSWVGQRVTKYLAQPLPTPLEKNHDPTTSGA